MEDQALHGGRGRGYTTFSHELIGSLLDELLLPERQHARQLASGGKYRLHHYRQITLIPNTCYGSAIEPVMIKSKVSDLKKLWRRWCTHLRHVSSGPWTGDPPRSSDHVERDHFLDNRECRQFSNGRAPPHPEKLAALFGNLARDETETRATSQAQPAAHEDEDDDSVTEPPPNPYAPVEAQRSAPRGADTSSSRPGRRAREHDAMGHGRSSSKRLANVDVRLPLPDIVRNMKPQESAVTRAVRRLDGLEMVEGLSPDDRYELYEAVSIGSRADVVLGVSNDSDLEAWAHCLLQRTQPRQAPPSEQQLFCGVMR